MSDNTLTVYEKCKHGRVDAHDDVIADVIGCPGGREIVLRRMQTFPEGCWVEVSDE